MAIDGVSHICWLKKVFFLFGNGWFIYSFESIILSTQIEYKFTKTFFLILFHTRKKWGLVKKSFVSLSQLQTFVLKNEFILKRNLYVFVDKLFNFTKRNIVFVSLLHF